MNTKKLLLIAAAGVTGVIATGVIATGAVFAATANTNYPSIVQKIAQTFNLDPAKVQSVFEQDRQDHEKQRLDQLVADKKITAEQRTLLEAKENENHTKMKEIRNSDKTDAEKRQAIEDLHKSMQEWLKSNNINLPGPMMGGHSGPGPMGGMM